MIEQLDQRMSQWVQGVLGDIDVSLEPPAALVAEAATAVVYLVVVYPAPSHRGGKRPARRWILRYLITTAAPSIVEAHGLLGELVLAAADAVEFDVEASPAPLELWRALGVPPRPALLLQVPATQDVPEPRVPLVRQTLQLETEPLSNLSGTVLGPGDLPLMGAKVEIPSLGRTLRSDAEGAFVFRGVPTSIRRLRVEAKGRVFQVEISDQGSPLVIRCQPMED